MTAPTHAVREGLATSTSSARTPARPRCSTSTCTSFTRSPRPRRSTASARAASASAGPIAPWSTMDHSTPTLPRKPRRRRRAGRGAAREARRPTAPSSGITLYDLDSPEQGIVHVIGPELGVTQPGAPSSAATATRRRTAPSARSPSASGRARSSTCSPRSACSSASRRPSRSGSTASSRPGVGAKDIILALIAKIGTGGATGHVIEYRGTRHRGARHGRADDRLQHVDRGGRARRDDRPRRDHVQVARGPPVRSPGRRVDRRRREVADPPPDPGAKFDATVTHRRDHARADDHLRHEPRHGHPRHRQRADARVDA